MKLWLDAHLSPALAAWVAKTFAIESCSIRDVGLRESSDLDIFYAARAANAVVVTKDADFVELVERLSPPPQVLWVTCGNTTNARLKQVFLSCFDSVITLLQSGEPIVEINEELPPKPR